MPDEWAAFTTYPLPGTALFERVKDKIKKEWNAPLGLLSDHVLIFDIDFSETKMKFAILKGQAQFWMRRRFGNYANFVLKPFEMLTDVVFRVMK